MCNPPDYHITCPPQNPSSSIPTHLYTLVPDFYLHMPVHILFTLVRSHAHTHTHTHTHTHKRTHTMNHTYHLNSLSFFQPIYLPATNVVPVFFRYFLHSDSLPTMYVYTSSFANSKEHFEQVLSRIEELIKHARVRGIPLYIQLCTCPHVKAAWYHSTVR